MRVECELSRKLSEGSWDEEGKMRINVREVYVIVHPLLIFFLTLHSFNFSQLIYFKKSLSISSFFASNV